MPDIETLHIVTINCNTIEKQTADKQSSNKHGDGWYLTNKKEKKTDIQRRFYANKDTNPNGNTNPMVVDNNFSKINFLPDTSQEANSKTSAT